MQVPQSVDRNIPSAVNSSLVKIHVTYHQSIEQAHTFTYGACNETNTLHHVIARSAGSEKTSSGDRRLVWLVDEDNVTGGCISASTADSQELLGRSLPIDLSRVVHTRKDDVSIPMTNASGINAEGPWFDGVNLLANKEIGLLNVKAAKGKSWYSKPSFSHMNIHQTSKSGEE
jgi:hypothetical protein